MLESPESSKPLENPGNLENSDSQEDLESINDNNNEDNDRFNSDNIGFFDSFYESKSINTASAIEHSNKSIFFRDIYIFVNRVKNIAYAKKDILLRQNLQIYLRETTLI